MVLSDPAFFGNSHLAFNGIHCPYNLGLRTNPYANTLYEKSQVVMNMTALNDDRAQGESAGPRKRIAMACGRCRKRKIRCSGDKGDGQPCTNCTNSNHLPCQFLRVNSCETHYRADFDYNIELSRTAQARPSVATLASQVDRGHPATFGPGPFNPYRTEPQPHSNHNSIRIWHPDTEQGTPSLEYNLSPNTPNTRLEQSQSPLEYNLSPNTVNTRVEQSHSPLDCNLLPNTSSNHTASPDAFLIPFRTSQDHQPRSQEPTVYLSNATFATGAYSYGTSPHLSTLAFRPAPVVNIAGPSGPGTFPILNAMPQGMHQPGSSPRPISSSDSASERRQLQSPSPAYRAVSVSPGTENTSQRSPRSRPSPSSMLEPSNAYGLFSSSPNSGSIDSTGSNVDEVKLDGDGPHAVTPQGEGRPQQMPELHYRYTDTTQYRNPSSPHVAGIIHITPTLSSQVAVGVSRSNTGNVHPSERSNSTRTPSASRY